MVSQVATLFSMIGEVDGIISLKDLQAAGVSPTTVQRLVTAGKLERAALGFVALPGRIDIMDGNWVAFALQVPQGVVCLFTAADHYGMTQEIFPEMYVFVPRERGRVGFGPDRNIALNSRSSRNPDVLTVGVDVIRKSGVDVRITSRERTLVDMFLFSSLSGAMDGRVAEVPDESFLDSLNRASSDPEFSFDKLYVIADTFGCADKMSPFLKTFRYGASQGFSA